MFLRVLLGMVMAFSLAAQTPAPAPAAKEKEKSEKEKEEIEQGIPITSKAVKDACGACHKSDEKGRMTRISYRRTTPEGWQETIKRMVLLNSVQLQPEKAREIVRYLADNLGLAPEEAQPAAFEVERRMIDYKYSDRDTDTTCNRCHSMGRVIAQRRTKGEWDLLVAMHRGYYPLSDFQAFRRGGPPRTEPGPDGRPPDNRHPMDKALAHLSGAFPLKTPEWSAWSANLRPSQLAGRWAVSGYELGKGPLYGETRIVPSPASPENEYTTETRYTYARTGAVVKRQGKVYIYTGFQWRGRSNPGAPDELREVMFVDRGRRNISGRWFTGAYDELGMDVKLQRIGADPIVLGLDRSALKTGTSGMELQVFGANFPAGIAATAVDLGPGVKVTQVVSATPELVKVRVDVSPDAPMGARDVFVAGASRENAAVVYNKVDYLKVRPQAGMARVGGVVFPKQFQQFEAAAYSNGPDAKPDTKDDLDLGAVNVTWSVEEFTAVFGDDDIQYVGTLDANGFFTPNIDGPNPKRKNGTNNYGDIWVVATYTPPAGSSKDEKDLKPMRARAHLLVTVPLYMRWEQREVAP